MDYPVRAIELHYPMIQFLIITFITPYLVYLVLLVSGYQQGW